MKPKPGGAQWPEIALGDICELKYGKSLPKAKRVAGDVPVYGSNGIVGSHNKALTEGTTIIVGRKGSFGEVNLSRMPCWPIDTTYYVDRTATDVDLKWLAYRLTGLGLTRLNRAAAIPGLNRDDAYRQRLLLPPLAKQRHIAHMLDRAEAVRANRRAALFQLNDLTRSVFYDLFGDPATNPLGWETNRLGDCCEIVGGATPSTSVSAYWDGEIFWATPKDLSELDGAYISHTPRKLTEAGLGSCSASVLPTGSVLFSSRAPIGHTAINMAPMATNQGCKSFIPKADAIHAMYLFHWLRLRRRYLESLGNGATFKEVSKAIVSRIVIALPPITLQNDFARRVAAVDRLKAAQCASLAKVDILYAALSHQGFRGEL